MRVLLVDDDVELLALLREYLERDGFSIASANNGADGVSCALSGEHDIVVLDIMMPGMNGINALVRIREKSNIPVIMLTARGDDTDRITGLELGADDYVAKPCSARELAARVRAILKRSASAATNPAEMDEIVVGTLIIRPPERYAECDGLALSLTSSEFNLLEVLARNAGQVVSKADLSQAALGKPLSRFDRSIDVHMSSIRKKLGRLADGRARIETIIRKGYQLITDNSSHSQTNR